MILPTTEELDEMAKLLTASTQATDEGHTFEQLGPDQRARVVELCLKAKSLEVLCDIAIDFEEVTKWFRLSKLWEGN